MRHLAFTVIVLAFSLFAGSAQDYKAYLAANPDRVAAIQHAYEYIETELTPAPKGYKPFYISHYGRHGSRYHSKESYLTKPIAALEELNDKGILNDKGQELLTALKGLLSESKGMEGMLTTRGAEELYGIGSRMYRNYPEVFKGRKTVISASSYVPRCLMSMTSLCDGLRDNAGSLNFLYHTGEKYYEYLCHENDKKTYRKIADGMLDNLYASHSHPEIFLGSICTDAEEAMKAMDKPASLVSEIWRAGSIAKAIGSQHDVFRFFSFDELIGQWIIKNNHFYCQYGNSIEAEKFVSERAYPIVQDIIKKADEAIASDIAADLRFGHDMWLVPLVSYMGLKDFAAQVNPLDAHECWNVTKASQFASNLQIVFYRNKSDEILVKFLYNEQETFLNDLESVSGPYYRWADVRRYLLERDPLVRGFLEPPHSAKPMVWWHWMNGNITEDGLRKDIEWMHRIGIGGFHVFDAGINTPQIVENRLDYMSPEWKKTFRGAIALADSLGMEVAIPSSPGWSSTGGPWVSPEDAMKKIVWREFNVSGGKKISVALPEPYTVSGKFQNIPVLAEHSHASGAISEKYYTDVAVIAVRRPESDRTLAELGAKITSSGGHFTLEQLTNGDLTDYGKLPAHESGYSWIQYEFPQPQTIKALSTVNEIPRRRGHSVPAYCQDSLQVSDDGVNFRTVFGIPVGDALRQTISFEGITAKYFRLKHKNPKAYYHYSMGTPDPDPEFSLMAEFVIYPQSRINHAEEKAAFAAGHDLALYPTTNAAHSDASAEVVNVTGYVRDGVLKWNAPEGDWTIYRFGASLTGKKNHPASPEATGLEVDKIDPDAWKRYFRNYLDMYKDASGGLIGERGIQYVLTDSYEAGHVNWSPHLFEEFERRRGYDPVPFLPAVTGVIVRDVERSEKFLLDWRKTIGELFEENYANLTELVRKEYGMKGCFIESHENGRCFVADGMAIKKTASYPMSAIWVPGKVGNSNRIPEGKADIRESASVAHIYGQNLVAAESLTSIGYAGQAYSYCPENLKPTADLELAHGLNKFVIHEAAHQPLDSHKPGLGLGVYGQWFNRHETWAEQAEAWIDYLARSSYMLQQGKAVADILWYYGEDNNITGLYSHSFPDIPAGYNFDFANSDVLLHEIFVKDKKLCTNTGMRYSVLCLDPNVSDLSPEMSERIEYFRSCGIPVCGWTAEEIKAGLEKIEVEPDWSYTGTDSLNFVHRSLHDAEIYWISSPVAGSRKAEVSLRCSGLKPYKWNPVTGKMEEISYRSADGRTILQLEFEPHDAYFIVLKGKTSIPEMSFAKKERRTLCQVDGNWDIIFEDRFGDRKKISTSDLTSWTDSDEEFIRHFSGTATYSTTLTVPSHNGRLYLDLGEVKNIAEVYVNSKKVQTLWKTPFVTDISEYVSEGENCLEIKLTNLWVNRLIGDAENSDRKSYTSKVFFKKGDPLLPSGMLGPVIIVEEF